MKKPVILRKNCGKTVNMLHQILGTMMRTLETTEILVYPVTDPVSPAYEKRKLHVPGVHDTIDTSA